MSGLIKKSAKGFIQNYLCLLAAEYCMYGIEPIGPQNPKAEYINKLFDILIPYYGNESHIVVKEMLLRECCEYIFDINTL